MFLNILFSRAFGKFSSVVSYFIFIILRDRAGGPRKPLMVQIDFASEATSPGGTPRKKMSRDLRLVAQNGHPI